MLQIASSGEENTWVQGPWQIPAGQSQGGENLSFLLQWVPVARFACRAGAIALSPDGGGYSDKLWDLRSGDPTCGALSRRFDPHTLCTVARCCHRIRQKSYTLWGPFRHT